MPNFTKTVAALTSALAVVSATSASVRLEARQDPEFIIPQVANPNRVAKNGPSALYAAYVKYNIAPPASLVAAAKKATQRKAVILDNGVNGAADAIPHDGGQDWVTRVQVGTPPQTFHVVFDTGSSDFWLFGEGMPESQQKRRPSVYRPSNSGTASKMQGSNFSIRYGNGDRAMGDVYTDVLSIGNGLSFDKQAVEAATNVSGSFLTSVTIDGLLGLGFSQFNNAVRPKPVKTIFENLKARLSAPRFGVDLKSNSPGTFDFGAIPAGRYTGEIEYLPVNTSSGFWGMTAPGYAIGSGELVAEPIRGIADTGTTLLLLPTDVCKAYWGTVEGSHWSANVSGYVFPCNGPSLPSFSLKVGGNMIKVPGAYLNYTYIVDDDSNKPTGECFGAMQPGTINIFGDVIHKAAYVVYEDGPGGPMLGWANKKLLD